MAQSFTLGQVLSAGAVGFLSGYAIVKALARYDTHTPKGLSVSKKHKAAKAADQKKGNKSNKKESKDDPTPSKKQKQIEEDSEEYLEDDDDEDDEDYSDLDSEDDDDVGGDVVDFDLNEEFKMVLVIRSDLNMGKGKAAAQCCHATLANYKELLQKSPQTLKRWERRGQAKVTLKVDNEDDMLMLQVQARSLGLAANSIRDAGRTQIAAGSRTVLAVGPGPISVINSVTGQLKLY
ncbi:MAG: peptidyl-tRNA hydrolase PTH2-domain-containing protein [Benniella sp.]|nr:MAG: peptidyl-tRNA hydrolase PTH2-domain-containing protein [Benniella sp.]